MMGIRIATMTTVFARKHIVMDYKGLEEGVPPRTHVCRHTWLDLELLQSLAVFIISAWLASESRAKRKTCQVDFYFFFTVSGRKNLLYSGAVELKVTENIVGKSLNEFLN